MTLAQRLKERRKAALLTQEQVAQSLRVPREHIAMWEGGAREPGTHHIQALAALYRVNPEYLAGKEQEVKIPEWTVIESGLRPSDASDKVLLWRSFLDSWASFSEKFSIPLKGRERAPRELSAAGLISDARRASTLANDVRQYYGLGLEPIRDIFAFLNEQGVLICKAPLGDLGETGKEGISGLFYNHPKLGYCILVNSQSIPLRQNFTVAHEFAHALYHYSMLGLISRDAAPDPKEKFADAFAANFLVPSRRLRQVVEDNAFRKLNALSVLRIAYYFGVSYKAILNRLRSERLISPDEYTQWYQEKPKSMASLLRFDTTSMSMPNQPPAMEFPALVLEKVGSLSMSGEFNRQQSIDYFGNEISQLLFTEVTPKID